MSGPYHLFERYGVELEYMIVAWDDLRVRPIADELIRHECGEYASDVERGPITWSNELVLHVIELKTTDPATALTGLPREFQSQVQAMNGILAPLGARLMPTSMHPLMDPDSETRLWPHECNTVYASFDRIFNCRGHGWSNVQAAHLNLPFAGDEEFGRLHAAIRLILPILPALAASSPIADGRFTGLSDTRMEYYRNNSRRVPLVAGRVIPEPVFTPEEYRERILVPMYKAISPLDPDSVLQDEWLNARGTIARFVRDTFEIRVVDIQECPAVDLALLGLLVAVLRGLVSECWSDWQQQKTWEVAPLEAIMLGAIRHAEEAAIDDAAYLRAFGLTETSCTAGRLWRHIFQSVAADVPAEFIVPIETVLHHGSLATRIAGALGQTPDPLRIRTVYESLCTCLERGTLFMPSSDQNRGPDRVGGTRL
jgi:glutamate---cysteine ligase / carboxylate-amine ligase